MPQDQKAELQPNQRKKKRDSKRVYTDRAWKQRACTVDEDNHGDDENAL